MLCVKLSGSEWEGVGDNFKWEEGGGILSMFGGGS